MPNHRLQAKWVSPTQEVAEEDLESVVAGLESVTELAVATGNIRLLPQSIADPADTQSEDQAHSHRPYTFRYRHTPVRSDTASHRATPPTHRPAVHIGIRDTANHTEDNPCRSRTLLAEVLVPELEAVSVPEVASE